MIIDNINNQYKFNADKRNLIHLLSSFVGSYIIYEVHRQNLYSRRRKNYVDIQFYNNAANALLLEIRLLFTKEKGTELWLMIQIANLSVNDFKKHNSKVPANTTEEVDKKYYKNVEENLNRIKDMKKQFDSKKGYLYDAHSLVKKYETLEFHIDNTPEKNTPIEGGFLNGFINNKSYEILEKLDDIIKAIDYLIKLQGYYEDSLDWGFPAEKLYINRSGINGLVKDIHKRIGLKNTKSTPILKSVKKNLPNTLHYLSWYPKS